MMQNRKTLGLLLGAILLGALWVGLDVAVDPDPVSIAELILDTIEKALMIIGAGGVALMLRSVKAHQRDNLALMRELDLARVEGFEWRNRVQTQICGLGREIMKQFEQWALTTAEAEVGMLLLKGLRHGEIATLRGTSEATVRQQARSIYLKSGLAGKSAFSAYFLEDLLPAKAPTGGWVDPADALNSQRKDVRPEQPRDSEVVKKP